MAAKGLVLNTGPKYGQGYIEHGIEAYEKKYHETMVINLQKQAARLGFEVTKIELFSEVC